MLCTSVALEVAPMASLTQVEVAIPLEGTGTLWQGPSGTVSAECMSDGALAATTQISKDAQAQS